MNSSTIRIRPATANDSDAVAALLTELGHPTRASDIPSRLAALAREGGSTLVAVDERDLPLGLICLALHTTLHTSGQVAYITTLVTAAAARRRGIGKLLVERAFEWAREHRCARLSVTSAERRADAHAFYPACGLPYTGRRFAAALESEAEPESTV
ncbi:MAG: GNAT family N-acetyltransferase [Gemmatimonadota bacterium]|nr:GNAT family N-acetyltransferase [Gemmatimonadota bacterium]